MDSVIKSLRANSVQIADGDYVRVPAVEIRYALQRIAALELELEAVHEQKSGELLEDKAFRHEWERGQKALAESCQDERAQILEACLGGGCERALAAEFERDKLAKKFAKSYPVPTVTAEMLRAGQLKSELGKYVCANMAGGYDLMTELFNAMISAAPVKSEFSVAS